MPAANQPDTGFTLTNATFLGRQFLKYGLIFVVVLMAGRMFINASISYWKALNPPPPPPPTVGFGRLPMPVFPEQATEDKPVEYILEVASGRFPDFGDRAKVFFMPRSVPSLLDDEETRVIGASLNYPFEPSVIGSIYRFTKTEPLTTTLEVDAVTKHIFVTSDFLSRPDLIINPNPPSQDAANTIVKSFISSADLLEDDIATVSGEVTYLKSLGSELQPALSFSEAEFAELNLNRAPIDGYSFYTPDGTKGIVHAILSGALRGQDSIVELEFQYQPIDYSQVETYPIRTAQQAWDVLKVGEGYVAQAPESGRAIVRQVTLGYFDSYQEQQYMQPIYVFTGDNFMGYVPALDPIVWVSSAESEDSL